MQKINNDKYQLVLFHKSNHREVSLKYQEKAIGSSIVITPKGEGVTADAGTDYDYSYINKTFSGDLGVSGSWISNLTFPRNTARTISIPDATGGNVDGET